MANEITVRTPGSVLTDMQGGDFRIQDNTDSTSYSNWVVSAKVPKEYKPFKISLCDPITRVDTATLVMLINPRDFNVSQAQVVSSANARSGWINTLWGNQQATLSTSGMTAGFYYVTAGHSGGLTNFYRKKSASYLNLLSLITLFKNNGNYYMDGVENPTFFRDGRSRVINVMDIIHISYDGSDYLGYFNSFSLTDVATNPYRLEYTIEFSVSIFGSDPNIIEGHIKKNGNEKSNKVVTAIQGKNTTYNESVVMDQAELNRYFPINVPLKKYADKGYVVPLTGDKDKDTTAQLRIDEGVRTAVYRDSLGFLTVGIGHRVLLTDGLKEGDVITEAQVQELFAKDYAIAVEAAHNVVPDLDAFPENVQAAVTNMAFNLGQGRLSEFTGTIACLRNENYEGAARRLEKTLWYQQVGPRAVRIVESIRNTGKDTVADSSTPISESQ